MIHAFRVTDQLILIALITTIYPQSNTLNWPHNSNRHELIALVLLLVGWISIYGYFVKYKFNRLESIDRQLTLLMMANVSSSCWLILVFTLHPTRFINAFEWMVFFVLSCTLTCSSRVLAHYVLIHTRKIPSALKLLLIIGPRELTHAIANKIESKPELGFKITRILDDPHYQIPELRKIVSGHCVDEILYCLSEETTFYSVKEIINEARTLGIVVRILSSENDLKFVSGAHLQNLEDDLIITFFQSHHVFQLFLKRTIDILISLALLILLAPLFLVIVALIKSTSSGPILFTQVRVGLNQRKFYIFKFRSMIADAENFRDNLIHLNERNGPVFKITNDPRITRFGRWLRRTSLDELPQLYNVLMGEMSLVGPRPPLPDEVKSYDWIFRKRLSVKPGITCIWQVSGRDHVAFDRWMQMDHEYVENWSLWLDMKILIKTIPAVVLSRGAS